MKSGTYGNTRFHYRSTLDGNEVVINVPAGKIRAAFNSNDNVIYETENGEPTMPADDDKVISPDVAMIQVELEGADLKGFVLDRLRHEMIGRLEQATDSQLVQFLPPAAPEPEVDGALVMRLVERYADVRDELRRAHRQKKAGSAAEANALAHEFHDLTSRIMHLLGAPVNDDRRCDFFRRSDEAQCVLDEHVPSVPHDYGTGPSAAAARND